MRRRIRRPRSNQAKSAEARGAGDRGAEVAAARRRRHHQQRDREHARSPRRPSRGPGVATPSRPPSSSTAAVSCANVRLPWPDTRMPDRRRVPEHGVELEPRAGERGRRRAARRWPRARARAGGTGRRPPEQTARDREHDAPRPRGTPKYAGRVVAAAEVQRPGEVGGEEEPEHREREELRDAGAPAARAGRTKHAASASAAARREHDVVGGRDLRVAEHRVLVGVDEEVGALAVRDAAAHHLHRSALPCRRASGSRAGRGWSARCRPRRRSRCAGSSPSAAARAATPGARMPGDREARAAPRRRRAHDEHRVVRGVDVGEHAADELVGAVQRGLLLDAGLVVGEEVGVEVGAQQVGPLDQHDAARAATRPRTRGTRRRCPCARRTARADRRSSSSSPTAPPGTRPSLPIERVHRRALELGQRIVDHRLRAVAVGDDRPRHAGARRASSPSAPIVGS